MFCATQRTGSTMVHDDFHNLAGDYGRNAEWLYGAIIRDRPSPPWAEVWEAGAPRNRVGPYISAKVMFHYAPHLSGFIAGIPVTKPRAIVEFKPEQFDPFYAFFRESIWVHIYRRDIFAQAASMYIAQTTQLWESRVGRDDPERLQRPDVPFDSARMITQYNQFKAELDGWKNFFRHYGITPITIAYEDAIASYPTYLDELMQATGLPRVDPVPERRLRKVGTSLNDEFAARLRAHIEQAAA
jgi:LPS sulfotransferase NodH